MVDQNSILSLRRKVPFLVLEWRLTLREFWLSLLFPPRLPAALLPEESVTVLGYYNRLHRNDLLPYNVTIAGSQF